MVGTAFGIVGVDCKTTLVAWTRTCAVRASFETSVPEPVFDHNMTNDRLLVKSQDVGDRSRRPSIPTN